VEVVRYKDFLSKDRLTPKSNSSIIVKKSVFRDAGGFRWRPTRTYPCDDCDFLLRAGVYGPAVLVIEPPTVEYRLHEGNIINDTNRMVKSVLKLILADKKGMYPGGRGRVLDRYASIGGMVLAWSKKAFLNGCASAGLRLFVTGFPMVVAGASRKLMIGLRGKKPTVKIKWKGEESEEADR
jgi:hypothetical protein